MNKVLKMDFKGQTAVLSAFVLVGMMFLAPAITEKALAMIVAEVKGVCGVPIPENNAHPNYPFMLMWQTHPCQFTYKNSDLKQGVWKSSPRSGTTVGWDTAGSSCAGNLETLVGMCPPQNEEGSVVYKVGGGEASLYFYNPASGENKCEVKILSEGPGKLTGVCEAGSGMKALFTYHFHSLNK